MVYPHQAFTFFKEMSTRFHSIEAKSYQMLPGWDLKPMCYRDFHWDDIHIFHLFLTILIEKKLCTSMIYYSPEPDYQVYNAVVIMSLVPRK